LVLTTHYMDEAEQLCDRLVVMDGGRIAAEGSPSALIREWSTREVVELRFTAGENEVAAEKVEGLVADPARPLRALVERVEVLPDRVLLYSHDGDAAAAELHQQGVVTLSVLVRRSTLEDVFLRLTGRTLVD
jgi:lipooligosaccharide transport system ATP-binding protein